MYRMADVMGGVGGGAPEAVAGGSKDVTMNVSITYKVVSR
jgi:hypothetical protein